MLIVTHPIFLEHDTGPGHPERPARLAAILGALERRRDAGLRHLEPRPATREELERVHDSEHVESVLAQAGRAGAAGPETPLSAASVDAAMRAAGAVIEAIEHVCATDPGGSRRALALVRPPGHHAEADRSMGFCVFGNVAVGAAHALALGLARRVLIVDWDVHHGNGTQHQLQGRDDVLFVSVHEWPLYPGTGAAEERGVGAGEGLVINLPLPAGCGDEEYLHALTQHLVPAAGRFEPDLVLVSAGFDADARDPLAGMSVTPDGFRRMADLVRSIADRHAGGRLVAALEGGYDLEALVDGVEICLEAWCEAPTS